MNYKYIIKFVFVHVYNKINMRSVLFIFFLLSLSYGYPNFFSSDFISGFQSGIAWQDRGDIYKDCPMAFLIDKKFNVYDALGPIKVIAMLNEASTWI